MDLDLIGLTENRDEESLRRLKLKRFAVITTWMRNDGSYEGHSSFEPPHLCVGIFRLSRFGSMSSFGVETEFERESSKNYQLMPLKAGCQGDRDECKGINRVLECNCDYQLWNIAIPGEIIARKKNNAIRGWLGPFVSFSGTGPAEFLVRGRLYLRMGGTAKNIIYETSWLSLKI